MENRTIKILAIDDNRDNLISIKALIKDIMPDAVTLITENGVSGLELAAAENPDVILLDIVMPVMDGFEVCKKLKADKKLSEIPVVFVTALKDDREARIRALEAGADAFLAKPIDESELKAQIVAMVKIKTSNLIKHAEKEQLAALVTEQTIELKLAYKATLNLLEDLRTENESRKISEEKLKKVTAAIENSKVSVVITDSDGIIEYANPYFSQLTEYATDEYIGKNLRILKSGYHTAAFYKEFWHTIKSGQTWEGEFNNIKKDGTHYWENAIVSPVRDDNNVITNFVAIKTDITLSKLVNEELKRAKEKAEESERLKSAFLANMSHEIRTPMNGILGFAGLLKEPKLTGEEQQEYIGIIEKSGVRMLNIINDIIAISKVESGQMKTFISPTNINEQIEYIYNFFKPEVEKKGMLILYNNSLTNNEATIKTDKEKIYAILTNLVKNAIKFSDSGTIEVGYRLCRKNAYHVSGTTGPVNACLVSEPDELEFFVRDNGVGIPKDRMEAIFDRFVQADIADKRAFQGAGLGLSISKAYVEMLGGEIRVDSEEGKGSCFYFTIPYNRESAELNTVTTEVPAGSNENKTKCFKILIAEDDEISGMLISMAIKAFGKNVLKATTGVETVEVCRNNPDLDFVLMDIKMPEMDGLEATRQIRKFNNDVIIIAQTAYALTGDREKAIAAGCNDYIAKPFGQASLTELMKKHLQYQ
ncbi:MAG: response regulator [Mariniphaga sp.]|nr:response regulator [Mariniphaga sp.]